MAKRVAAADRPAAAGAPPRELATVRECIRYAATRLTRAKLAFAHGTTDPVAEAAFLVAEAMQVHPDRIDSIGGRRVAKAAQAKLRHWIEQRIETRMPAAYLVNKMYMMGLPFYVDARVIVPRSFIGEILVSHFGDDDGMRLIDPARVGRVLDLCTGSGCLAILAAHAFPDATIDAVDLSKDALEVAAINVANHGLQNRIALHRGDLFAPLGGTTYDLIISNPPYVDAQGMADLPAECRAEPAMAFDGGADGLDLVRPILDQAGRHLSPGGGLLCEIGRGREVLEAAYPRLPLLWLDTEDSEGEVFWIDAEALAGSHR